MKSSKEYYLEVYPREKDLFGEGVKKGIEELGIYDIDSVKVRRAYILEGSLGKRQKAVLDKVAGELLADPVNEVYSFMDGREEGVEIKVYLKKGVLDVEGNRVMEALGIMGIKGIRSARHVRKYILKSKKNIPVSKCEYLAEKLLYNKVIEKIEIDRFIH